MKNGKEKAKNKEMKNKNAGSKKKGLLILVILLIVVLLLAGTIAGLTYSGMKAAGDLLSKTFSEPLDGATSAKVILDQGDGNLVLEKNSGSEQVLASGTLQYFEKTGAPLSSLATSNGITTFKLGANDGQPRLGVPWSACNAGTEWLIRLNPAVSYDIAALTGGGNVKIDLTGLTITRLEAITGGGNMEIILPDHAANLDVRAKTGAGKATLIVGSGITGSNAISVSSGAGDVTVFIPKDTAVRIKVTQGNVIVDPGLKKVDDATYATANDQNAADKLEITAGSGAGKVSINIR